MLIVGNVDSGVFMETLINFTQKIIHPIVVSSIFDAYNINSWVFPNMSFVISLCYIAPVVIVLLVCFTPPLDRNHWHPTSLN